jgi:DNA modification methylase
VEYVDLTEEEEALALAMLDPIAAMAATDKQKLDELLRQVQSDDERVQAMLAEMAAREGLDYGKSEPAEDPGAQVDKAEELREKWQTAEGQIWRLGDHLLACGDCTDKALIDRLIGADRLSLVPTDPPYNVGIDYGDGVDDEKASAVYQEFCLSWFGLWASLSDRQIVTPGCNNLASWARWFDPYHVAPWTKTNSMTNGKVSRFWCWEPVFFFGAKWKRKRPNDVFDYPIGEQGGVANHPCPKPLKMWLDLIESYSEPGDLIGEPFSGAGTTIVACEQLGRNARATELEAKYVAVALQRWADMTGKTPELVTS